MIASLASRVGASAASADLYQKVREKAQNLRSRLGSLILPGWYLRRLGE
jgi:hypothetical protein